KIGDDAGEGERRAGRGQDVDFARQPPIRTFRGKAHVHQRSRLYVLEGRRSLAAADARVLIHGKSHRHRIDGIAQGELVVFGVNFHDLAGGVSGWRGHAYADVAGKDVMPVVVELGVNINALAFFERQLRGFSAVVEDVRALVEIDVPVPASEDLDGHAVAHA